MGGMGGSRMTTWHKYNPTGLPGAEFNLKPDDIIDVIYEGVMMPRTGQPTKSIDWDRVVCWKRHETIEEDFVIDKDRFNAAMAAFANSYLSKGELGDLR